MRRRNGSWKVFWVYKSLDFYQSQGKWYAPKNYIMASEDGGGASGSYTHLLPEQNWNSNWNMEQSTWITNWSLAKEKSYNQGL